MADNDSRAANAQLVRLIYIVVVITGGFAILNLAANVLLERREHQGRKVVFNAIDAHDRAFVLMCHEGVSSPYYDFLLRDAEKAFSEITIAPGMEVDRSGPVACVRYPANARTLEARLETAPPRKPGARRVVVIGDSFTYGEGVQKDRAFPETLQHYADWFGEPGAWQILNFGLMGQDFPALYTDSFHKALAADPDVILYVWLPNDTPHGDLRMPDILTSAAYFNSLGYIRGLQGLPLNRLLHITLLKHRINKATVAWYRDLNGPANARGMDAMREYIGEMKSACDAAGVEFRTALFPLMLGGPGSYPLAEQHAYVAGVIREQGVPVADLAPAVLDRPAPELHVHPTNYHPNVIAHRNAARALANELGVTHTEMPQLKEHAAQRRIPQPGAFSRSKSGDAKYLLAMESLEYPDRVYYLSDDESLVNTMKDEIHLKALDAADNDAVRNACAASWQCVKVRRFNKAEAASRAFDETCDPLIYTQGGDALQLCMFPLNSD